MSKIFNKSLLLLVILVSIPAFFYFLRPGYFPLHDDTQVQRVYEMGKSLSDGMFPVRWVKDLGYGYGYPIFNFYGPLAYYFGGIVSIITANALLATKMMFVFGIILSGVSMYFLGKELWGRVGGFVAAIFYVYAPYHALNIYVRGDVGEFWAYAFIPLIFYSLIKLYREGKWRYVAIGALSYAAVIVAHNLSAFIITPFVLLASLGICFSLFRSKKNYDILKIGSMIFLGIILSSFYFVPALKELRYTNVGSIIGGGSDFRNHFVCLNQLWNSPWGFGGSNPGCVDGISFKLGKVQIFSVLLALALFVWTGIKNKKWNMSFLAILLGLIVSIFLTNQVSLPLWNALKPMEFIQFPWRYLGLVSFFISLICGSIFFYLGKLTKNQIILWVLTAALLLVLVINSLKIFKPQAVLLYPNSYYISQDNLKWTTSKISDEYMPKDFSKPKNQSEIEKHLIESDEAPTYIDRTKGALIVTYFTKSQALTVNRAYFPAWQARLDGKKLPIKDQNGKIGVSIPSGRHILILNFVQTPTEKLSNLLTLIGFVGLIAVIILDIKDRKNEKNT